MNVLELVMQKIKEWDQHKAGPLPSSDCYIDDEFNEEYFGNLREKRLNDLVIYEFKTESQNFNMDYRFEESSIKLELCDLIFDYLIQETVDELNNLF